MDLKGNTVPEVSLDLLESIRRYPVEREVSHCGVQWTVPALEFYSICPKCKQPVKLRSYAATAELEDVFDAVFEWMNQPQAEAIANRRRQTLAAEDDA
jgi:hypothetical protein